MARFLCVASLALAAVSAVSGHVIRHGHSHSPRGAPAGWQKDILQDYEKYHQRYLDWCCHDEKADQTEKWNTCCHPLLNYQNLEYLEKLSPLCSRPSGGCKARDDGCDGDEVSPPPQDVTYPPKDASPPPPKTTANEPPSKPEHSTTTSSSTTSTSPSATPTHTNGSGGGGGGNGIPGTATFYSQDKVQGSCGKTFLDSDFVVALGYSMDPQGHCGRKIRITHTASGRFAVGTCQDTCVGCEYSHIDLSVAFFTTVIGAESIGQANITYEFL